MSMEFAEDDSRHSFGNNNESSPSLSQSSDSTDYEKMETVVEYEWPLDSGKDYFIEEYLANYLNIKSMRRSYPAIERRRVQTLDEREYLLGKQFVNELQCDLGVIAISADQAYKLIAPDYTKKFEKYTEVKWQQHYEKIINVSWKENLDCYNAIQNSSLEVGKLRREAMKACTSWNATTNKAVQTTKLKVASPIGTIQTKSRTVSKKFADSPKISYFPVKVLPKHFVDYAPRFSSEFLFHLPVNTVLRPVNPNKNGTLAKDKGGAPLLQESCCSSTDSVNLSESSTITCDMDSVSSHSSTITCSTTEFDNSSRESFT